MSYSNLPSGDNMNKVVETSPSYYVWSNRVPSPFLIEKSPVAPEGRSM